MSNGRYESPVRHIWLFTTTKLYIPIDRSLAFWLVGLHLSQLHSIESRFMSRLNQLHIRLSNGRITSGKHNG
jgi:hypothetical protein